MRVGVERRSHNCDHTVIIKTTLLPSWPRCLVTLVWRSLTNQMLRVYKTSLINGLVWHFTSMRYIVWELDIIVYRSCNIHTRTHNFQFEKIWAGAWNLVVAQVFALQKNHLKLNVSFNVLQNVYEAGHLTRTTFRWTAWHNWLDVGDILMQKMYYNKTPFTAALVKHKNNPIWRNFTFFNDRCC